MSFDFKDFLPIYLISKENLTLVEKEIQEFDIGEGLEKFNTLTKKFVKLKNLEFENRQKILTHLKENGKC